MPATDIEIESIRFTEASHDLQVTGLLGWVSFIVNKTIILDGVAVRRTREGKIRLSFPARRDKYGTDHPYIRPIDQHARVVIEERVLYALPALILGGGADA
jgi:hypothetical protein